MSRAPPRAGELRHQIRIDRRAPGQVNALNEPNAWATLATRRAKMTLEGGGEAMAGGGHQGRNKGTFELRYLSGVLPEMRLVVISSSPSQVFDILDAVDRDGRREWLIITAIERVEEPTA